MMTLQEQERAAFMAGDYTLAHALARVAELLAQIEHINGLVLDLTNTLPEHLERPIEKALVALWEATQ
jgi:hypothetical protein